MGYTQTTIIRLLLSVDLILFVSEAFSRETGMTLLKIVIVSELFYFILRKMVNSMIRPIHFTTTKKNLNG